MNDDDLRDALRLSHADDAPPRFAVPKPRARAWAPGLVLAGVAAATIAILVLVHRPHDHVAPVHEEAIGMTVTSLRTPLDSLLAIPDTDLLSTTPHLSEGALP